MDGVILDFRFLFYRSPPYWLCKRRCHLKQQFCSTFCMPCDIYITSLCHLGFLLRIILAIFDLQVSPVLPAMFGVNWPFGLGEEVQNRFSRWMASSWSSDFCSAGHPHIGYEVSSKFAQGCKRRCHLKQNFAPPFACHVTYTSQVCVLVGKLQCCVWKISANKSRVYCCQFRDTLKIILFLIQFKNERLMNFCWLPDATLMIIFRAGQIQISIT